MVDVLDTLGHYSVSTETLSIVYGVTFNIKSAVPGAWAGTWENHGDHIIQKKVKFCSAYSF